MKVVVRIPVYMTYGAITGAVIGALVALSRR